MTVIVLTIVLMIILQIVEFHLRSTRAISSSIVTDSRRNRRRTG
jgi:hypothetical protein